MSEMLPIYHVEFSSLKQLGLTMLRFQEQYESPMFSGKVFDHEEYIDWYMKDGSVFTYANDWAGFNLPSSALAPFIVGQFDPLWRKERLFLDLFRGMEEPFYIIATATGGDQYIMHEIVHGLYDLYPAYATDVKEVLARYDVEGIYDLLRKSNGYAEHVLPDEANAYTLTGMTEAMKASYDSTMSDALHEVFSRHFGMSIADEECSKLFVARTHRLRFPDVPSSKA